MKNKGFSKNVFIISGVVIVALVLALVVFNQNEVKAKESVAAQTSGNLIIEKNQITENAKFFAYQVDDIKMEVLAVKAPDGTIRTAFNTCQVCFSSGRGYYEQEGNLLICQNCGNRFTLDDVEKVRGGCNPVPIIKQDKEENAEQIIISEELLKKYKVIFENWKNS